MTDNSFSTQEGISSSDGRLEFSLPGGGNIAGINMADMENSPDLLLINKLNRDYLYFEAYGQYALDFVLVNVGNQEANDVTVKAISDHPYITFTDDEISIPAIASGKSAQLDSVFNFSFNGYNDDNFAGNLMLEISVNGVVANTQKIVFFATPVSPYISDNEVIILDGRSQSSVPVFNQGSNSIQYKSLSGGIGNGNGIPEKGEEVLVYIKLEQGLSPKDKNTFHKTHLIGEYDDLYVRVNKLKYDEKISQAGATSISAFIMINDSMPDSHELDLWFRTESLYNENKPQSRRATYEFKYDYRRLFIPSKDSDTTQTGYIIPISEGLILGQNHPNPVYDYTRIDFSIGKKIKINLKVFDVKGREVKELINEVIFPGKYFVDWNGTNDQNKRCNSGVYIYRLSSPGQILTKKMTLL